MTAIAVAMWNEIRADRTLVETMAEIPPCRAGRRHGSDLQEPEHARSLSTAIRYLTAAGMATQRAQRAFFQHRKAKRDGLLLPAAEARASRPPIRMARTKTRPNPTAPAPCPPRPSPIRENCTNEFAGRRHVRTREPLAPLRARLDRLLAGPGPTSPEEWDLVVAIRAARLPGAAPYLGTIDPGDLDRLLAERRFDGAGLAWLAALRPAHAEPEQLPRAATG